MILQTCLSDWDAVVFVFQTAQAEILNVKYDLMSTIRDRSRKFSFVTEYSV